MQASWGKVRDKCGFNLVGISCEPSAGGIQRSVLDVCCPRFIITCTGAESEVMSTWQAQE